MQIRYSILPAILLTACLLLAGCKGEKAPEGVPTPEPTADPMADVVQFALAEPLPAQEAPRLQENSQEQIAKEPRQAQIDPDCPMVALTFDDGPTPGVTDAILDVLERYGARATFFVVGSRVPGNESILARAVSLGCEIGCHTYNHDQLKGLTLEEGKKTVLETAQVVKDACGYEIRSLRPPEGQNSDGIKEMALACDMALVYWSHSTHDYRQDDWHVVADYVQYDSDNGRVLKDGDIVLLHDLRSTTSDAMETAIRTLTEQGYQLVTVQELLNASEDGFAPGKSYKRK